MMNSYDGARLLLILMKAVRRDSYTCVYAKHYANISNEKFGYLAMVLPILALLAKPIACSLTDARGCHKEFLIGALVSFGLSYGSLGIVPFFKDPKDHSSDSATWILIATLMTIGNVSCACVFSMNDALASNYARKHNKSYARMRIYANLGWASGALLIMSIGEISWLPFRVLGCMILSLFILADIVILLLWPYPEDFVMFHDGSTIEQRKVSLPGPNTLAALAELKKRSSISRDMIEKIKTGRSKSVGSLPKSQQFDKFNNNNNRVSFLEVGNEKLAAVDEETTDREYTNFQCQIILLKMIIGRHKSFLRNMVLFTMLGAIIGCVFNFEYDYFKERIVKDDAEFEFISGLCLIAQVIPSEILLNIFAVDLFRLFGQNANMSLALVAIGLRCFFYANILPYTGTMSVLISEFLHGPSVGLYWVLAVDVGSHYALMVSDFIPELKRRGIVRNPKQKQELAGCLRATSIGIMSSSAEGLGMALGSLLGGFISNRYGYPALWNCCAILGFSAGFINLGWDLVRKLILNPRPKTTKNRQFAAGKIPKVVISEAPPATSRL